MHCQISIFEIKMMVKKGVILISKMLITSLEPTFLVHGLNEQYGIYVVRYVLKLWGLGPIEKLNIFGFPTSYGPTLVYQFVQFGTP